ncbi:hypothetical protein OPS25_01975 [Alteromonas ponticola]|uniref:Uncharacterized protein n=1 Tax=Alteromonas aquimaris TaxID=2998417 RepID=A0ABT3P3E8_9ALTE|nr:hypothetical protein [Alteromonas aquimaris]MCW8107272.1 hypothetical protein [Alteromonas aquimaris]
MASWDFNAGEHPDSGTAIVEWKNDHGGVKSIPGTDLQGIEFFFRGKDFDKDATSEWRFEIKQPQAHTFEYLKFLQPSNFYHRAVIAITAAESLNEAEWNVGDTVENDKGIKGKVAGVDGDELFIIDYEQRFPLHWGKDRLIKNLSTSATFHSEKSREFVNNNKFSTQWQGKYSNGGMTLETHSVTPLSGGEVGVGFCRPVVNTSNVHKTSGTVKNAFFDNEQGACFNPDNNGKIVEFVIERKRSSSLTARDGGYRIWRKVEDGEWELVFMNMQLQSYVQGANYFDNGYVMGWSNSGYDEDTTFWLLEWQLWNQKPDFLK